MSTDADATAGDSTSHDDVHGVGADPSADAAPRRRPVWQESLVLLAAAVVVAVVVKAFFLQAFYIPSASMEPGLVADDRILVEKVSGWTGSPERGDVVVFEDPGGWLGETADDDPGPFEGLLSTVGLYPEGGHLVKRVIGVAGDTVECCDPQGRILVNGQPLAEGSYVAARPAGLRCDSGISACDWSAGPVPAGEVFVLGDNRAESADSTAHLCLPDEVDCTRDPFVDLDLVVGRVLAVAWPLDHAGFVGRPESFDDVPDPRD